MDLVVGFLQEFAEAVYQVTVATLSESDEIVGQGIERVDSFTSDDPYVGIASGRAPGMTEEELKPFKAQVPKTTKPILFLVDEYRHGKLGTLYVGVFGGPDKGSNDGAFMNAYVTRVRKKKPLIISSYYGCIDCKGSGHIGSKRCKECHGLGWTHASGEDLQGFGERVKRTRLTPPSNAEYRAIYNQD